MQAIILAAGMGKRLGNLTSNSTKCMVSFNGRRLIEYTLDAIAETKVIDRIVMVVGHGAEELVSFIGNKYKGIKVEYVHNPIYDKTNNIYSLFLAKEYLESDDTILLESDLIFDKSILLDLINDASSNIAVVAKHESWMDGTVALLDETDHVSSYISKNDFNWSHAGRYFKTVNIYKFSEDFCKRKFVPYLGAYISSNGTNAYYEEVFKLLTLIDSEGLKALPVGEKLWYEIDDLQDLDIASVIFSKDDDRVHLMQKRYGGYWRFPRLKDFCYLVNPYFPPSRMADEMRENCLTLISQYPSGQNIQNMLAAKMFGCDQSYILVGNGAAELIKGLGSVLTGNICIPVPTFDEYSATITKGKLVEFHSQNSSFDYTAEELISFCNKQDISTLILINPDNPTGHFLAKKDVLHIIEEFSKIGKMLILDESFVDFVDGTSQHSLLDDEILSKYQNLVVIKSISKSYGVPGARLGIMATSDKDLMNAVRDRLSIWNINSFGEYFLQIIGKYCKDYWAACGSLANERERLYKELKGVSCLKPVRSFANYILCEVTGKITSSGLTKNLLCKYSIFIKDCKNKKGFENRSFVRIAVRDAKDNDYLLSCLKKIS